MCALRVLLMGGDPIALKKMARRLKLDGVNAKIVDPLRDGFVFSERRWDFLMVDLNGLNSFMRGLLPAITTEFPNLPIIGIARRHGANIDRLVAEVGVELDAYVFDLPRPEDLIVSFPHVASRYKTDTGSLHRKPDTRPLMS